MSISYNDFTSCVELENWKSEHLEYNIINIETLNRCPFTCRVWYWYNNYRNRNL